MDHIYTPLTFLVAGILMITIYFYWQFSRKTLYELYVYKRDDYLVSYGSVYAYGVDGYDAAQRWYEKASYRDWAMYDFKPVASPEIIPKDKIGKLYLRGANGAANSPAMFSRTLL